MAKEYIERGALVGDLSKIVRELEYADGKDEYPFVYGSLTGVRRSIIYTEAAPAADVVEVKRGKWISASKKQGVQIGMKCSLCGARIKYSEFFNGNHNYCHKCGAKMDGERRGAND